MLWLYLGINIDGLFVPQWMVHIVHDANGPQMVIFIPEIIRLWKQKIEGCVWFTYFAVYYSLLVVCLLYSVSNDGQQVGWTKHDALT